MIAPYICRVEMDGWTEMTGMIINMYGLVINLLILCQGLGDGVRWMLEPRDPRKSPKNTPWMKEHLRVRVGLPQTHTYCYSAVMCFDTETISQVIVSW